MAMDRRVFLGAMAGTLAYPALVLGQQSSLEDLYQKAKEEGEVTWYIAYYRTETAERVGAAFSKRYPGIKVNVVRATGQVIFQRLSQDLKVGAQNCDVFSGTDASHYAHLKDTRVFAPYRPATLDEILPIVREAADPDHYFTATDTSMTMMVFGTRNVTPEDAPKAWTDLADPKWKGQLALPHPGYSGAMGAWVVGMNRMYGWEFIEKLAQNKPLITRSLADPPVTIGSGERRVGIGPASTIWSLNGRGTPVQAVPPTDGVQLGYASSGVIANSKHPNAARLLMEFLLSQDCGQIVAEQYSIPIRADVEPKPGVLPAGSVPGFRASATEVDEMLPGLVDKWRDLFGV